MNKKIIAIGIVCLFLLIGFTTVSATQNQVSGLNTVESTNTESGFTLTVVVYDAFDREISGCHVTAKNEETQWSYDVPATKPGGTEYFVGGLPLGTYTITATHKDYKTKSFTLSLNDPTNYWIPIYTRHKLSVQPTFLSFLERFPNAFPVLRHLLN